MSYSEETLRVYEAMSKDELFDYSVIHCCPYSWNLEEYIPQEVAEWKLNNIEKKGIYPPLFLFFNTITNPPP